MGRSGSGKSTLERELITSYPTLFHKVVSVTTRKPRDGEVDGFDYHFITEEKFNELDRYDELIQTTTFAGNHYGSLYSDYTTHHPYATLVAVPESAKELIFLLSTRLPETRIINIYFNVSEQRLFSNMLSRGDQPTDIKRRLNEDKLDRQFEQTGLEADLIITDEMLTSTLPNTFLQWLKTY